MKQKELLLWVVAIAALALSLIAVIGPKGLKSDAAMRPATMMQLEQAGPITSYGTNGDVGAPCRSLNGYVGTLVHPPGTGSDYRECATSQGNYIEYNLIIPVF